MPVLGARIATRSSTSRSARSTRLVTPERRSRTRGGGPGWGRGRHALRRAPDEGPRLRALTWAFRAGLRPATILAPAKRGAAMLHFKTIIEPFRIKSVESVKFTRARGARAGPRRGGLQRLPAARGGRADRPAHRLGHGRDVGRAVGRDHAGRRVLRGQPLVLPLPRRGPGPDRLPPRHPHPPGPRGRADPVPQRAQAGRRRPEQQPLRHDAREHRGRGGRGARPRHPRGPRAARRCTPSRATWTSRRSSARSSRTATACRS